MAKKMYKCPICKTQKEYDLGTETKYRCKACHRTVRPIEAEKLIPAKSKPSLSDIEEKKQPKLEEEPAPKKKTRKKKKKAKKQD